MKRRTFLGMMLAGAGAAALGGPTAALASEERGAKPKEGVASATSTDEGKESKMSPEMDLVGYCGRYCGKCPASAFNVGLGVTALQKVNDTIDVGKSAEMIGFPPIRDMAVHCCDGFKNDMASFVDLSKMAFLPCCRKGCVPPCKIPECCKQKGYQTCAECDQTAKCEKLGELVKYRSTIDANLQAIKKNGVEKWAKSQYAEAIAEKKAALHKAIDEAF